MRNRRKALYRRVKRACDVIISLIAITALLPVFCILAVAIAIFMGRPILFRQVRIGQNAARFTVFKFRTMVDKYDDDGDLLPDEYRIPPFGAFLRRSSLDELPQLVNILRGDMSLVGPRPLLVEYLEHYTVEQHRRHETKPGITGWAQVNGRNETSWSKRLEMDVWYVDEESFLLDLNIIVKTISVLLSGRGTSKKGHATMPRFTGQLNEVDNDKTD